MCTSSPFHRTCWCGEFQEPWPTAGLSLPGLESSHRMLLTRALCFSISAAEATKPGKKGPGAAAVLTARLQDQQPSATMGVKDGSAVSELFQGCCCPEPAGGSSKMLLVECTTTSLGTASTLLTSLPTQAHRPQTETLTKAEQGYKSIWHDSLRKSSKVVSVTGAAANFLTSQEQGRAQPCSSRQDLPPPTVNSAWTEQYQINKYCTAPRTLNSANMGFPCYTSIQQFLFSKPPS